MELMLCWPINLSEDMVKYSTILCMMEFFDIQSIILINLLSNFDIIQCELIKQTIFFLKKNVTLAIKV